MENVSPLLKILLVDDDEVDRMIVKRSLRTAKLEADITTATIGAEALRAVEKASFDCIMIDFMLPDINGLQLLQEIRDRGIMTPALIVTSHGDERIAVEAMRSGASDYLPKTLLTPEGISKSIKNAIKFYKIEQERRATEQQLKRTQEQLGLVIAGAPIILWATDVNGVITMSKGNGLSLIGVRESEHVGQNMNELYKYYPTFLYNLNLALQGQEAKAVVNIKGVWFDSLYMPLRNESGNITGMTGVGYDITERIQAENELKRTTDSALTMAQVKEQFLANMSHEIRTPMNGILGLTSVLEKTNLDEQQKEYLNAINTSANNLMVIINDLLDFSKIEAGKITLESIAFDVRKLIKQLFEILEIKAKENNNTLKLLVDSSTPQLVMGDPVRLSQILNNLLGNALKFTLNGTVKLSIEVIAEETEQHFLEFTVQDTGIGIPENKLNIIFDKFTQGSNDTTRRFGGTGLGLAISKDLVEVLGGKISVESQPGKGSIFRFVLPYKKTDQNQVSTSAPDEKPKEAYAHLAGKKVLLAEDNTVNQMLVNKVLLDYGLELHITNNGIEAIEALEKQPYDVILMDMQMPEMDGYEAMQHIREKMPAHKNIPIIALTAHATKGEATKCIIAGANSYISKPFQTETLLREISSFFTTTEEISEDLLYQQEPTSTEEEPIDLSFLTTFAEGNKGFMRDIITVFMQQAPGQMKDLERAVAHSNWIEVKTITHKLKSSLALIGMKKLEKLNAQIEENALNRLHVDQIPSLVKTQCQLLKEAIQHLEQILKQL